MSSDGGGEPRGFALLDLVAHPVLKHMAYSELFARCRANGFCFDVTENAGTVFNLVAPAAGGCVGLLCVAPTRMDALSELLDVLLFVD